MLGVHIAVDLITAAAITLITTTAALTAIATMATITIIGATLIAAIAIGETDRLTALGRGPQHTLRPFFLSAVRSFRRRPANLMSAMGSLADILTSPRRVRFTAYEGHQTEVIGFLHEQRPFGSGSRH